MSPTTGVDASLREFAVPPASRPTRKALARRPPMLVEGPLELSTEAAGPVVRTNRFAGGWVPATETGLALLFSSTSHGSLDGFDVPLARGTRATIELRIDSQPTAIDLVHLGGKDAHPKESTFRIALP